LSSCVPNLNKNVSAFDVDYSLSIVEADGWLDCFCMLVRVAVGPKDGGLAYSSITHQHDFDNFIVLRLHGLLFCAQNIISA